MLFRDEDLQDILAGTSAAQKRSAAPAAPGAAPHRWAARACRRRSRAALRAQRRSAPAPRGQSRPGPSRRVKCRLGVAAQQGRQGGVSVGQGRGAATASAGRPRSLKRQHCTTQPSTQHGTAWSAAHPPGERGFSSIQRHPPKEQSSPNKVQTKFK